LRDKGVVMICNDRYHCMAHIQYFYDMILRLQATIYNFISLLIKNVFNMLYGFIWKYNTPLHPLLVNHTNIAISGYNSIFRQNRIHIWFFLHGPLIISHDLP
jgi:hypothetical protein